MLKNFLSLKQILNVSWTYSSWVCCKCREPNEKTYCWVCNHKRCNSCQDGF